MSHKTYLLLFLIGLIPQIILAQFEPTPGYLDAAYYYAGGIQLVKGHGFTEPYLWNYLDGATSLPHPSHTYWMPLASIVAAFGMWLTGQVAYSSARLPFLLIAALNVPITAALAYSFSKDRALAIISGLLAAFSVYSAPFVIATENFGIVILLGGLYFIVSGKLIENPNLKKYWLFLGLLVGLQALSRSDGLLWFPMTLLLMLWLAPKNSFRIAVNFFVKNSFVMFIGFLLVMTPWYIRNLNTFGTLMTPGGSRALWLTAYAETFIYPPETLTAQRFFASGWDAIISARATALGINTMSSIAAHGEIILFPFVVIAIYGYYRNNLRVKLASIAWLILFFVMTIIFPFAGPRGAFFHAGMAFQPMWWALAPLGLDEFLLFLRKRKWGDDKAKVIFRAALVLIAVILTAFVAYIRLFSIGWGQGELEYPAVEEFLLDNGIQPDDIVIVRNAPGYYLATGRPAISLPFGTQDTLHEVARQFDANYLILEPEAALEVSEVVSELLDAPQLQPGFIYMGDVDGVYIFKIEQ